MAARGPRRLAVSCGPNSRRTDVIELILMILAIALMAFIAEQEGRSKIVWGGATFLLMFAGFAVIPIPYLRVLAGFVLAFVAMIVAKARSGT